MFFKLSLLVLTLATVTVTAKREWQYKFTYTTSINSQMSLDCGSSSAIWIGWSHYGTRNSMIKRNENSLPDSREANPFSNDRVLDL